MTDSESAAVDRLRALYPEKFCSEAQIFARVQRGARLFVHTGCGEPQYLVQALVDYVAANPGALVDVELFQVWPLGLAPYTAAQFKRNFRLNSFFIGEPIRNAVNEGLADYTPVFLSQVPGLFNRGQLTVDVALIQVSLPDEHGCVSLGVSVDIVKAAVEVADLVIAQINPRLPRVHGDGFLAAKDIHYFLVHDEPLLEYTPPPAAVAAANRIGHHVARIIQDGDTIQVGYGSLPNAVLAHLHDKRHLGVHTELLGDGLADLIRRGVVDNSRKTLDRGKTVAAFAMGSAATYRYLHDQPNIHLRTVDYTNNPLVIAQQEHLVAVNSALAIDLTGQATAESLGRMHESGVGGTADFMRGAIMAPGGRSLLILEATAQNETVSRIVPMLEEGAGVTLHRGDVHYVVTEFGIAHLHGKNIRERAMDLIAIAHPKFRSWLIKEAKRLNLIYRDQAFIPGKRGEYPEHLEAARTTRSGLNLQLRPVKLSDEPLLKEFFYSLSDQSLYRRFISSRKDMPHERLQEFVIIDYSKETTILASIHLDDKETVVGIGQFGILEDTHTAEVSFVVRDDYQKQGIGSELLKYLELLARRQGLLGFVAEVLAENQPMLHLFESMGFDLEKRLVEGVYELRMGFNERAHRQAPG